MSDHIPTPQELLLEEFRRRYPLLQTAVHEAIHASIGDSIVLERLGDDIDEFRTKVDQHVAVFPPSEASTVQTNLLILLTDVRQAFRSALNASHYGKPTIIRRVRSGQHGRPKVVIDEHWLCGAYDHRGPSKLARFLGCSRTVVLQHLHDYRIIPVNNSQGSGPMNEAAGSNPSLGEVAGMSSRTSFRSRRVCSDADLDNLLVYLRTRFPSTGVKMLQGTLAHVWGHVTQKRIRDSLLRIDPIRRAFQRTPVRRRLYKVAGPNALSHHDGQHGLIRWGVVIHGFIDGDSRLITGLQANNNNRGATVLALFMHVCAAHGIPQRVRGDHGVENIMVAEWMERVKGEGRGSYIWGRSIHNIRIERLWVDVTSQFGQKWANFFTVLEGFHGLDVNNTAHIWLLHVLFLADINADCALWMASWNHHRMTLRGQASQSPAEMWQFGVARAGERGEELEAHELQTYGVDWAAMHDDGVMTSFRTHNPGSDEGSVPWTGRRGPPPDLNMVSVDPPECPIESAADFLDALQVTLMQYEGAVHPVALGKHWIEGLAFCRVHHTNAFL